MNDHLVYKNRRFHHLWLRDNCYCEQCKHTSGQRLHETWQLKPELAIEQVNETPTGLEIFWVGDEPHRSFFSSEFLA